MQTVHTHYLDDSHEMISDEELKFWSEYPIKGLGDFYTDFGDECPANLASPSWHKGAVAEAGLSE